MGRKATKLEHVKSVTHVLVIPNYKETVNKLRITLNALTQQTFPLKQLFIVLAMEERESEGQKESRGIN